MMGRGSSLGTGSESAGDGRQRAQVLEPSVTLEDAIDDLLGRRLRGWDAKPTHGHRGIVYIV
jgi:hypothetical protein